MVSVLSAVVTVCVIVLPPSPSAKMIRVVLSILSPIAVTDTGSLSFSGVFSVASVGTRDRASPAWC